MSTPDPSADLLAFLRARYDEDELTALAALGEIERWGGSWQAWCDQIWKRTSIEADAIVYHMVRGDPAAALADIAAKRAIVDAAETRLQAFIGTGAQVAFEWLTLRLLASPYAEHPAYRREWKPVT